MEPCVALASALRGEGRPVVILGLDDFRELITSADVEFVSIGARLPLPNRAPAVIDWAMMHAHRHQLIAVEGVQLWLRSIAADVAEAMLNLVRPTDVVISGVLTLDGALALRSALGCRVAVALFAPCIPTRNGPSLIEAVMPTRASVLNSWGGTVAWLVGVRWSRPSGRIVRRRLGLPRQSLWNTLPTTLDVPLMLAASSLLVPAAADWPSRVRLTGQWGTPSRPGWVPPDDLLEFLERRPAPLFVGFGTVGHPSDSQLFMDAARMAGVRIVTSMQRGSEEETGQIDREVYVVGETPHAWLFPHMAGVIHHGSAGTTSTALRQAFLQPRYLTSSTSTTTLAAYRCSVSGPRPYRVVA